MNLEKVIRVAALSVLNLVLGCASYGPARANERVVRNVVFAAPDGNRLRLDLYIPKTAKPAPVVIWIFGGSWKFGSKGYHLNIRDLTRAGIAVAAIEYRLSRTAIFPAQLKDCQSAVDWLREHGAEYGLDPKQIGVSGESAGGHLAALLGTVEGKSRIKAVCALYPPTDLVILGKKYTSPGRLSDIDRLLGGMAAERPELAREASPMEHASADSPPFLFIHGAKDDLVPIAQSEMLDKKLNRAGVESRIIVVPEKGHWFLLNDEQMTEVGRFFRRHFGLGD